MIISSAPLRISFAGGGSDLPKFLASNSGAVVSCSLDKNVYVTLNKSFNSFNRVAYTKVEIAETIDKIEHPIVRNALEFFDVTHGVEITSIADVPANGTGLGSSSSFTVALVAALAKYTDKKYTSQEVAHISSKIEIELAGDPIGLQDQYAAAFGGMNKFLFENNFQTSAQKIFTDGLQFEKCLDSLNLHGLFFHIDKKRSASKILQAQNSLFESSPTSIEITKKQARLVPPACNALVECDLAALGELLSQSWEYKSNLNGDSLNEIATLRSLVTSLPIYGAKLLGAGGGGFLFILAEPENHVLVASALHDYRQVDFRIANNLPKTIVLR
jgi:D-glycero-alpha-D-manno-heptose-7-phosphate kinase